MPQRTAFGIILVMLMASGCIGADVEIGDFGPARGDPLEFRDVAHGRTTNFLGEPEQRVYTDSFAWQRFWRMHTHGSEPRVPAPDVDWGREVVVTVAIEVQPSAADHVAIRLVQWDGHAMHVSYARIVFEQGECNSAAIVNQPLHGVAVMLPTKGALRVAFHETVETRPCGA